MIARRIYHLLLVLFPLLILFSGTYLLQAAGDGIPDNCEHLDSAYYQPTMFPRYELQNAQFVLADWTTGADVKVLESGLTTDAFWIIGWSPDCRYLVAAVNPSRDYYVWDTIDGRRIGLLPHGRHIDWSPNSEVAVVQSDAGAYLWQFPSDTQVLLTSEFNAITKRNFTDLNWNLAAEQLVIRLESKGRTAFDLTTGEPVALPPVAEQVKQDGYITIVGTLYHCNGYTGNAPYIYLRYDSDTKQVVLQTGWSNNRNTVLVLEQSDIPIWRSNNWSLDCRYISAALGDKHHTDTIVWDVVLRRRVAVFPDAHEIPHPFVWSPYSGLALIQTRSGGYLWNVATDTKTLLHDGVIIRSGYSPQVANFYEFKWDEKRGQLLTVGANTPDGVTAYDAHTGQQIAFYAVPQPTGIVSFYLSPDGSKIDVNSQPYYYNSSLAAFSKQESNQVIWDRDSGTALLHFQPAHSYPQFSPDGHYLAEKTKGGLLVWDLTKPNADSSASWRLTLSDDGTYNTYFFSFVDNTTFEVTVDPNADNAHKSVTRWDIVTGAFLGKVIPSAPASNWSAPQSASPGVLGIAGQPGDGIPYNCQSNDERSNLLLRYEARNRRLLLVDWSSGKVLNTIEESLPQITHLGWSPQCHYFTAQVEEQGVVVWDAQTLIRQQVLPERIATPGSWKYFYSPFWVWSADDAYALLQTEDRTVMWRAADRAIIPLGRLIPLRYGTYWDYGRNQVIIGGSAFDLDSGVEKAFCKQFGNHNFSILNNGNIYVSFTTNPEGYYDVGSVAVCNLNTLESFKLDTQPMIAAPGQIAVSADGHYLVVAREAVRIWDLQSLSGYVDERSPVYIFDGPAARVVKVRFLDSNTLQTTDIYGTIQTWDVMKGILIPDS